MYKIKFHDVTLISNKKKVQKNNIIFFFYGIGCRSDDFIFLYKSIVKTKYQLLIAELPGHNYNLKQTNFGLEQFTKNIFLFIKKKNMKNIIFFTHSVGGIIPILLAKKYLKKNYLKSLLITKVI